MVVSNSTKIGKRQAKSNAQAQQATRAKKLNAQGQNIPVPTPTLPTPTNTLQPGYNPSAQFNFETGQNKPLEQTGTMREAFQAGVDPRVRAILQQRGVQELSPEEQNKLTQFRNNQISLSAEEAGNLGYREMIQQQAQNTVGAVNKQDNIERSQLTGKESQVGGNLGLNKEQQFLMDQTNQNFSKNIEDAKTIYDSATAILNNTTNQNKKLLEDMATTAETTKEELKTLAQQERDATINAIREQEKREKERLAWEESIQLNTLQQEKNKAIDAEIARLALSGGYGSIDAGNTALKQVDQQYERAIRELGQAYDFKETDVAAKFAGLRAEAETAYTVNVRTALTNFNASLERISLQNMANNNAIAEAERTILNRLADDVKSARQEKQATIKDIVTQIQDQRIMKENQARQDRILAEENEWKKYVFATDLEFKQWSKTQSMLEKDAASAEKAIQQEIARRDKMVGAIAGRISSDKVISNAQQVVGFFDNVQTMAQYAKEQDLAYKNGEIDKKSMSSTDVALVNAFFKMTDPDSVVRETEFAQIPRNMSLLEGLRARANRVFTGGILTSDEREQLLKTATELKSSWDKTIAERQERFYLQIDSFNNSVSESARIDPSELGLPERLMSNQRSSLDQFLPENYKNPFSGGNEQSFGDKLRQMGRVTQEYDTPIATKANGGLYAESTVKAWGGKHAGVDIAMPVGTPIQAPVDLTIVSVSGNASDKDGWGVNVLAKDAQGNKHRFSHLSNYKVKPGQQLKAGQLLATSGNSGNSTGPHLDYRIQNANGQYVNPFTFTL